MFRKARLVQKGDFKSDLNIDVSPLGSLGCMRVNFFFFKGNGLNTLLLYTLYHLDGYVGFHS